MDVSESVPVRIWVPQVPLNFAVDTTELVPILLNQDGDAMLEPENSCESRYMSTIITVCGSNVLCVILYDSISCIDRSMCLQ